MPYFTGAARLPTTPVEVMTVVNELPSPVVDVIGVGTPEGAAVALKVDVT